MPRRHGSAAAAALSDGLIITRAALRAAELDPDLAARETAAERWQRLAPDAYVPHREPPSEAELVAAARHHIGSRFVITGTHALAPTRLRWLPTPKDIHVLVPPACQIASTDFVRITRTTAFDRLETWLVDGVRYATNDRAVIDTARSLTSLRDVRGVVLGAVWNHWTTPDKLRAILDAGQRNGSGFTRRAILDAERGCASPPEAELVDGLIGCRLPFFVNPTLWLDGRLLGCPDVWVPGLGIGGEVESKEEHGSEEATQNTYDRHERITAPGIELVHLSVRRIRADVREAAAHFLSRAWARALLPAAAREPAGLVVVPRGPLLR